MDSKEVNEAQLRMMKPALWTQNRLKWRLLRLHITSVFGKYAKQLLNPLQYWGNRIVIRTRIFHLLLRVDVSVPVWLLAIYPSVSKGSQTGGLLLFHLGPRKGTLRRRGVTLGFKLWTWLRRRCSKSSSLQSKRMVQQTVRLTPDSSPLKTVLFFFLNGMRSCTGGGRIINHWQEHGGQPQFTEYRQVRQKKRIYKITEGGRWETAVEEHGKHSKLTCAI